MIEPNPIPYSTHIINNGINEISITVKRLDLVHPTISGNKFFKLKYNLAYVKTKKLDTIVSFGGAYSNHIFALAQACNIEKISSVGYIRGDELANKKLNPTLQTARDLGMHLKFISRSAYRNKDTSVFLSSLHDRYPQAHIIPEGGSNTLAIKGASEILTDNDTQNFDIIVCAVGTGGTITGIINASDASQTIIGISALNSTYQADYIRQHSNKDNWQIVADDVFGGYAKYNKDLLSYIESMNTEQNLPLEPIYTAKVMYRLPSLLSELNIKKGSRILVIHTGGLQAFSNVTLTL